MFIKITKVRTGRFFATLTLAVASLFVLAGIGNAALKISGKAPPPKAESAPAQPAEAKPTPKPAPPPAPEPVKVAPAPEPVKAAAEPEPTKEAPAAAPAPAPEPEKVAPAPEPVKEIPAAAPAAAPALEAKPAEAEARSAEPAEEEAPREMRLSVDSTPQGAKVFIDGAEYGVTPVVIDGLSDTPHEVVFYHPTMGALSKKVESGAGSVSVKFNEESAEASSAGFINIETNPPNARVDVDGRNAGLTPIKLPVAAGRHTLLLSRQGFLDKEVSVTVAEREISVVRESLLEKPGSLLIIVTPAESEIFLDGQSVGKAAGPMRIAEVSTGAPHEVRIEKKGYVTWKRENVFVVREKTETILASLYPENNTANVRLYSDPASARVWLDGKEVGVAGVDGVGFVTTKGAHILKFELNPAVVPGYRPLQVSVTFDEDNIDFKGLPFKLPVIDEAFIFAQRLYERGDSLEAMNQLDRVPKEGASYPESRVMVIDILKDLGRIGEIPAEFDKLFDRPIYQKNPILNLSMGYWSIRAAAKATGSDATKLLEKGLEALDRAALSVDYFPASERQALALKVYYYTGIASEMLFDLAGDKKYIKKGGQAWELFFGRLKSGEETLGDDWVAKAKRHQTNLQYLGKKIGG